MDIIKLKANIKWFLNDCHHYLGMRSNYYTILNTQYGSIPFMENDGLIGNLPQIHKHRLIYQALYSLQPHKYRYLQALYNAEYQPKYPPIIRAIFADKTGLALCLHADIHKLLDLCTKSRHNDLNTAKDIKELNDLISLTDAIYTKLHKELQYNPYLKQIKSK